MKLYFQSGSKRLAIDTESKTYCTNYFYLGGFRVYVKIDRNGLKSLVSDCVADGYTETETF